MTHALKTTPESFADIKKGEKGFDVRKNDRSFKVGDKVLLQEHHPEKGYTGEEWEGTITYIMDDAELCKKGFVIFALKEREN
jgi:hypothetical protein